MQDNNDSKDNFSLFSRGKSKKSLKARVLMVVIVFFAIILANFIWKRSQASLFGEDARNLPRVIRPIQVDLDVNHLRNGIYPVAFSQDSVELVDNGCLIEFEVFSHDLYSANEMKTLKVGDSILLKNEVYAVDSVRFKENIIYINGGLDYVENGGLDFELDEDGKYCFRGFSGSTTYTSHGKLKLLIPSKLQFVDRGNVKESMAGIVVEGEDVGRYLKETDWNGFNEHSTRIRIEEGAVVEFFREYRP